VSAVVLHQGRTRVGLPSQFWGDSLRWRRSRWEGIVSLFPVYCDDIKTEIVKVGERNVNDNCQVPIWKDVGKWAMFLSPGTLGGSKHDCGSRRVRHHAWVGITTLVCTHVRCAWSHWVVLKVLQACWICYYPALQRQKQRHGEAKQIAQNCSVP
jgi:hypothetical protein